MRWEGDGVDGREMGYGREMGCVTIHRKYRGCISKK